MGDEGATVAGPPGELYVYYRLPQAATAAAQAELAAAFASLRQSFPTISSRCLQRLEKRDEILTWMEIHQRPGGLDAASIDQICAMLAPWPSARQGPRHVELFATLPSGGDSECA